MNKLPRGIRNNNPGNIERGTDKWRGMADDQSGDPRFVVFDAPQYGIRALAIILQNYQKKYGLKTIRGLINRWAPPAENDTQAYAGQVAKALGLGVDDEVDLVRNVLQLEGVVAAIIKHENGIQPYDDKVIREGIDMSRT